MKTALYVAGVTRAYRKAIDDWYRDPAVYEENREWYLQEVSSGTNRQFTTGFFYGKPSAEDHIYENSTYVTNSVFLGIIRERDPEGRIVLEQKNKFSAGQIIELLRTDGRTQRLVVRGIYDAQGMAQPDAPHAKQELHLDLIPEDPGEKFEPEPYDVLRM